MTSETVVAFLEGKDNHLDPMRVLNQCSWEIAGEVVGAAPHTIYRILNHMTYWQTLFLARIDGKEGPSPDSPSAGWPGQLKPESEMDWQQAVARFEQGFDRAMTLAKTGDLGVLCPTFRNMTMAEGLVFLAQHNNHHLGQIITLCQVMGHWPQPKDVWDAY
ncbi:MAG: DinB family protein [Bacteroidota bacterium]